MARCSAVASYAGLVGLARRRLLGRTVLLSVIRGRTAEGTVALKRVRGIVAGISDDGVVRVVIAGSCTRYLGVTQALEDLAVLF